MTDVTRNQARLRSGRREALATRAWGLLFYGAIVVWCLWALPTAAVFVVPAAAAAAVLHVVRGRPWWAALAFVLIVAVAPMLFWPSMATDVLDDLGSIV